MSNFNADLARFIKKTDLAADVVVRKVALQVYAGVTKKTPVDTGRARANWNMSVGSVDYSVDEEATKVQRPALKKGDGEKAIYITNNLPYIQVLEEGSSTQAPNGMVEVTLNEVRSQFR